jgi:uncharacterized protein YgiM (DUF1202 family)
MSGSAASTQKKIVFAPVTAPESEAAVEGSGGTRLGVLLPMLLGVVIIAAAIAYLLYEPEPEIEVINFSSAFTCPAGAAPSTARMQVTASTLNVRAGPSQRADRLLDRTLRKKTAVTEECRDGGWSRVRMDDGRSGWVANEYLRPASS